MFTETIHGKQLSFETEGAVFSPQRADKGTLAMLDVLRNILRPDEKILDLGCGYGIVGIYAAKMAGDQNVIMSDIEPACVELSKKNAELNGVGGVKVILSDGFMDIRDVDFTIILSNPPYQADFSVPKHFIEKGFNRLQIGGRMLMVTKRKLWYKNKLTAIFGGVMIYEAGGYHVFYAEKRSSKYANK